MSEMISFGAGWNSTAMTILLINEGWKGPIVFADPGSEHPDTYCYMTMFERDWLKPHKLSIIRLSPQTQPNLYTPSYRTPLQEKCRQKKIVPIIFNRWCTTEYKRVPLTRWSRDNHITHQLIGIAAEEAHRATKVEADYGITLDYPLVNRNITRQQCADIIRDAGLPVPPKSGCWYCPFQKTSEWRALYDLRPDLFQQAVEMDNAATKKAGRPTQLGWNLKTTLEKARAAWEMQLELPGMPDRIHEYQMCECRL